MDGAVLPPCYLPGAKLWDFFLSQKSWLKSQHSENEDHGPITSWEIDGETVETVFKLYFSGLQNHCRW